jgi:hypothetical protein
LERVTAVSIIAGGFSAKNIDLRRVPGMVIAVNDAAYYGPRWDVCVSMDRLWSENRFRWMEKQSKPIWLRRSTVKNFPQLDHMNLYDNDHTSTVLSDDMGTLNGTHSGFCALNLAYHIRPRFLYLIGFDMARGPRGEPHWYPDYPWNPKASGVGALQTWGTQFEFAARQLRAAGVTVFQVGDAIPEFPTLSKAALEHAFCEFDMFHVEPETGL